MAGIDDKDMHILEVLKRNAKLSINKIAKKTGIPVATVHHRIKKLEADGVIEGYTVKIDKKKLGRNVVGYILIKVNYPTGEHIDQEEIIQRLSKHEYVDDASTLTGDVDIILKFSVPSIDELNKFLLKYIRELKGVGETKTLISLKNVEK